jgi:hypothetical protein
VVNDKVEATVHPRNANGYVVQCPQCDAEGGGFRFLFYDVAERFAELHEDATGHETDIEEVHGA